MLPAETPGIPAGPCQPVWVGSHPWGARLAMLAWPHVTLRQRLGWQPSQQRSSREGDWWPRAGQPFLPESLSDRSSGAEAHPSGSKESPQSCRKGELLAAFMISHTRCWHQALCMYLSLYLCAKIRGKNPAACVGPLHPSWGSRSPRGSCGWSRAPVSVACVLAISRCHTPSSSKGERLHRVCHIHRLAH